MKLAWVQVALEFLAAVVMLSCAFTTKDSSTAALWGALGGWYSHSMLCGVRDAVFEQ